MPAVSPPLIGVAVTEGPRSNHRDEVWRGGPPPAPRVTGQSAASLSPKSVPSLMPSGWARGHKATQSSILPDEGQGITAVTPMQTSPATTRAPALANPHVLGPLTLPAGPDTGVGRAKKRPIVATLAPTLLPETPLPDGVSRAEAVYKSVGKYSGGVKDTLRHGRGRFDFENGDSYTGEWSQGYMHGFGEYAWKEGQRYSGDWDRGNHEGRGFLTWPTEVCDIAGVDTAKGGKYTGSFKGGKREGKGSETMVSHGVYAGEWLQDLRCGCGTFKWLNGNTYDGDWKNDHRHGIGLFVFADGRRFEGRFENDFPREGLFSEKDGGYIVLEDMHDEKGMCFLILAVRATGTSFAVKFDPTGEEEIERLPPPIEKNEMGRREYVGPRYSMSASNAKENRLLLSPPTQAQTPIEMYEDQNRALRRASRSAPAQEKADSGNSSSSPGCNAVDENCDSRHQTSPLDQNMPLSPTTLQGETCLPVGHENISVQYRAVNPTTMGGMSIDTEKAAFPAVTAPVAVCIKLGLDFNMSVGEEGSSKRTMFEKELILDIANAADLPLPCFQVTHLQAGSVFAEIDILSKDGSDPFAAAALLVRQADAPGSSLLKGKLTRFLEAAYCPLLNLSAGSKEDVIQLGKVCSRVTRYAASRMRAASVDEASDSGSVQVPCREHVPETWPTSRLEALSAEMSENVFRGLMASPKYQHSDHLPSQPSQPPLVQKDVVRLQRSAGPNGTCDTVMLPVSRGGGGELGLAITRLPRGIIVSDKKTGSPAAYSHNLRVGDEIIKVDNVLVKHLPVQEVFELHPCLSLITFYRKPCTS